MFNVILDRGHGSIDKDGVYTTSPNKMYTFDDGSVAYEGLLNSGITSHIGACLNQHSDINVVYTVHPDDPRDISLSHRVRVANSFNPRNTIFVSIHCNASPSHNATGFEIFTTKGTTKSDNLATNIGVKVKDIVSGIKFREDFSDGDLDKEVDFYVLRKTKCPAVLVECGFFDNKDDYDKLKDSEYQCNMAKAIYEGILNYIKHN